MCYNRYFIYSSALKRGVSIQRNYTKPHNSAKDLAREQLLKHTTELCAHIRRFEDQLYEDEARAFTMMEFSINHSDAKAAYSHAGELL